MMMYRQGHIVQLRRSWGHAYEYAVELTDQRTVRALAYEPIVGVLEIGDRVILSGSAFERGLGTGGYMMIVVAPDRLPADPPPAPGHIMKARYTPQQFMVQGVDEQESPHHEALEDADSINGMPVIVADLHSALPAIVAGVRATRPDASIAYIMTDGGALPAWFSMAAQKLADLGYIQGTITCGQAFGGDLEAVNVHSALLAARHVWGADIAIVAQGPGNLGTGTRWGFSGVACGEAINAVDTLGGSAVACVRMSNADARGRHFGISHHTIRVLADVVKVPCTVPLPLYSSMPEELIGGDWVEVAEQQRTDLATISRLDLVEVDATGLYDALRDFPVGLKTMGRGLDEDVTSFIAAAAAGAYTAQMLD
ncbi:DUF3866 family protein [Arcanobacterium haemolyticum]|uniref:DUF3866 domain-containing protein n=1 Tax=Arcanobacterium haemolyticum (strain ATCC 9345 / DSM 20595 / CCM 5947 / CCUG 17215 / LMG 16163 / NBRC 15585 / NCTC 8452 / 11018) TaxID=644284 RepID=D7BNU0_ARCHD|nr:DUF3866 family protein [Arcanobacterium haemolyticum]ADH92589.1 protein of unknown function DUF952 [Arcanobacterium haemolyticum DSM 20595]QCX46707.1 DUF3866 family protein [Arcanobacterium haemolyticum]SQH28677.1 Protein of uncharacterised function (DUF3866) [Arcanobacterium haemolyticum]